MADSPAQLELLICRRLGQRIRGEARQILSDVYAWFTDGFDTLDLNHPNVRFGSLADTGAIDPGTPTSPLT